MATSRSETANILHELIADDSYHAMFKRFTREGKGRRPDANPPTLTNRVLVQLWDIMLFSGQEQKMVQDWFGYLYRDHPLLQASCDRLRSIMSSAYSRAFQLVVGPQDVFREYLDNVFDFNFISDVLSAAHIDRKILLGDHEDFIRPNDFKLSNNIVLDLEKFQTSERLNSNFTANWLFFIISGTEQKDGDKNVIKNLDIEDLNLISCVCALGLFYLKVSGPYWKLVNSSTTYSDFCHLVRKMHGKFKDWSSSESSCATDLLCDSSDNIFGSNFSLSSSVFHNSLYSFLKSPHCDISSLKQSLKSISEACAVVTSRQLSNFLDGSFDPDNEALVNVLSNCPLTNLIGESSFGDLDYDIRKRANCSYLQRTASHCIKRNKTCSDYLDSKSKSKKAEKFTIARRQRQSLVEAARSNEADVSIKIREKMVENQNMKIVRAVKSLEKHDELKRRIELSGGVCQIMKK